MFLGGEVYVGASAIRHKDNDCMCVLILLTLRKVALSVELPGRRCKQLILIT